MLEGMKEAGTRSCIIFAGTTRSCQLIELLLVEMGFQVCCARIHSSPFPWLLRLLRSALLEYVLCFRWLPWFLCLRWLLWSWIESCSGAHVPG